MDKKTHYEQIPVIVVKRVADIDELPTRPVRAVKKIVKKWGGKTI